MTPTVIAADAGRTILDGFVRFKLFGADTGGSFAAVEHALPPGVLGAPIHTHRNEDEYSLVLAGTLTALIGGDLVRAPAGTLVCKPRHVPHTFWNSGPEPVRLLEIIAPAGFEHYFDALAALLGAAGPPDLERVLALAAHYGVEMDFASISELGRRYDVWPAGMRPAPSTEPPGAA